MRSARRFLRPSGAEHSAAGDAAPPCAADAIIGVNFFADGDPDDFGRFDRSFFGLFKILGGESWFEALDEASSQCV